MVRVLLVEDDSAIVTVISFYLEQQGNYQVVAASCAEEAFRALSRPGAAFDIILLDIMLPDCNGINLCERLRQRLYCPILFISCIDDENVIVNALKTGGDDYLVKPFTSAILHARIEANLRRVRMERRVQPSRNVCFREFTLLPASHQIRRGDALLSLSTIEYQMLCFFIDHPNQDISLSALYENIWNKPSLGDVRTVMVHVHNLRRKIEDDPAHAKIIQSIRGSGYRFCATPAAPEMPERAPSS